MADSVISIRNVHKSYGKKRVFENFSLEFPQGRVIGLLGENGIGKTTLLKMIADLAKPCKGTVWVQGQPVSRHTRDWVSYLLEARHYEFCVRVQDAVQYHQDFFADFDANKARKMCESFGLDPQDKITKLSKGQQARLFLSLCLSRKTPLYLLDEPMSGFDPKIKKVMVETIVGYMEEGQTLIISSHLLRDLETIFDEVIILKEDGAVMASAESIREQGKSIEEFYMEVVG